MKPLVLSLLPFNAFGAAGAGIGVGVGVGVGVGRGSGDGRLLGVGIDAPSVVALWQHGSKAPRLRPDICEIIPITDCYHSLFPPAKCEVAVLDDVPVLDVVVV